ncbi:MAG: alpha/beta hydrolase [Acidobacteria bacterium]|nr:alpha/beta hydrolase [Acidobacteriota bacterium]
MWFWCVFNARNPFTPNQTFHVRLFSWPRLPTLKTFLTDVLFQRFMVDFDVPSSLINCGHPVKIKSPTLIVMGEFDKAATFPVAEWLLKSLKQSPTRRLEIIGHGSHVIQYETERTELYRVLTAFLKEGTKP